MAANLAPSYHLAFKKIKKTQFRFLTSGTVREQTCVVLSP